MKAVGFLALVLLAGAAGDEPALTLHDGQARPLDDAAAAKIRPLAVRLLESSNFNSAQHREILRTTPRKVHAAYRKAVAGRYLLLAFETPRAVKTTGGEVDVADAVIGLNGAGSADSLFTIDREGRVIAHEKYAGNLAVELMQALKRAGLL